MRKRRNRRLHKAAAYLLTAALVLSIGSGTSVLAGAEENDVGQTGTGNPIQTEQQTETPGTQQETGQAPQSSTWVNQTNQTKDSPDETKISEAVKNVQLLMEALPSVEDVQGMDDTGRQAAYQQTQEANGACEGLSAEERAQVEQTKVEALFDYFNRLTTTTGTSSDVPPGSVAEVNGQYVAEVNGQYYTDFLEALKDTQNSGGFQDDSGAQYCKLLKDVTVDGNVGEEIGPSYYIDLNGWTLTCKTLYLPGEAKNSWLKGRGTVSGNIKITNGGFRVSGGIVVNGDISQNGITKLRVYGSGTFRVNGNIDDFAEGSSIDSGVTIVCTGTCNETDIQDKVVTDSCKVDVTWGSMEFTYTDAKIWNPDSVSYDVDAANGGWKLSTADSNKIQVTNRGYDPVNVTYNYEPINPAVAGAFYKDASGTTRVAAPVTVAEIDGTDTAYLLLSGAPQEGKAGANTRLGSVSVTINSTSGGN